MCRADQGSILSSATAIQLAQESQLPAHHHDRSDRARISPSTPLCVGWGARGMVCRVAWTTGNAEIAKQPQDVVAVGPAEDAELVLQRARSTC